MRIEQIYTGCLAQGAYYIESEGEVAIIDPLREVKPYLEEAARQGHRIKYILETHFHADFVSGHVDLAQKTGAKIVYGPGAKTSYEIYEARDGEELLLGKLRIQVLHTPGHTLESTTFLLKDENGKDHAIFTGDTLFIGDVGRPDLAQKSDLSQEDLAAMLYDSLHHKIMPLADEVLVYPAHGAGSACGKNMSKETFDTLGHQKQTNYALKAKTKEEFIQKVTEGILPPPQYFAKNVMMNKQGYDSIDVVMQRGTMALSVADFEEIANQEMALVLDTRAPQTFAKGFIPNSIFIGLEGSFAPWVGALIPDLQQAILIVADPGREEEVVMRLARVGYDNALGFLQGGFEAWQQAGKEVDTILSISAESLAQKLAAGQVPHLLDARKPTEFEAEHAEAAINFPLDYINERMAELDRAEAYHLHCAGGYRSMIMASILKARGFEKVVDIDGGFKAMQETDIPRTAFVCPTTQNLV
ncbi:MAG: MBL fold metallo-hydrolase [Microscillaceae bacterium]|nr:MBL fold metallo-hydrolase [Microscillaceae bacterium]